MYYVYVLESLKDGSKYIGSTSDLKRRVNDHNSGHSRFTNQHRPYKLICYMGLELRSDAERFEDYLKSGYGRRVLKGIIRDYLNRKEVLVYGQKN